MRPACACAAMQPRAVSKTLCVISSHCKGMRVSSFAPLPCRHNKHYDPSIQVTTGAEGIKPLGTRAQYTEAQSSEDAVKWCIYISRQLEISRTYRAGYSCASCASCRSGTMRRFGFCAVKIFLEAISSTSTAANEVW